MSFEITALPEVVLNIGIPGIILVGIRYVLKSPVIIAYIEKRKACHLSDNKVRIARLKLKSKENITRYNHVDSSENSSLRVDRHQVIPSPSDEAVNSNRYSSTHDS